MVGNVGPVGHANKGGGGGGKVPLFRFAYIAGCNMAVVCSKNCWYVDGTSFVVGSTVVLPATRISKIRSL